LVSVKKPLPCNATSSVRPVSCSVPWLVSVSTVAITAPVPICIGLMPPNVPLGPEPERTVKLRMSLNVAREPRKPGVLTLARLLPMTSM
jgi:hypothetical protein